MCVLPLYLALPQGQDKTQAGTHIAPFCSARPSRTAGAVHTCVNHSRILPIPRAGQIPGRYTHPLLLLQAKQNTRRGAHMCVPPSYPAPVSGAGQAPSASPGQAEHQAWCTHVCTRTPDSDKTRAGTHLHPIIDVVFPCAWSSICSPPSPYTTAATPILTSTGMGHAASAASDVTTLFAVE